jgi:regulator of RNase E activity RraA
MVLTSFPDDENYPLRFLYELGLPNLWRLFNGPELIKELQFCGRASRLTNHRPFENFGPLTEWRGRTLLPKRNCRAVIPSAEVSRMSILQTLLDKVSVSAAFVVCAIALMTAAPLRAQLLTFSKQELVAYTAQEPFDRLPDGRPKVPDQLLERARELSSEEVWAVLQEKGFHNQYADGFQVLHPGKPMAGRVFTVQFMPLRPDIDGIAKAKAKDRGLSRLTNQTAIDMLEPGDVLVVDLFGKKVNGTIVGDNLFYYVNKTTHGGGLVVDGSIRDLNGISEIDMPAYFRSVDPTPIGDVMLTGINVPIRIGGVTVMPGDLVVGDREGIYFIPPQFVKEILDRADEIRIHDEWTKKKFEEGKYKSSEIYSTPTDPKLQREYQEYLKRRLVEIRKERGSN